jgi:archaellin
MKRMGLFLAITTALLFQSGVSWCATYAMKITVSMPKGSAGEKLPSTQPASTKFSPCSNAGIIDAVTFTLAYNAGSTATDMKDVYIILYTPNGTNTTLPTYQVATRYTGNTTGVSFVTRWKISDFNPATDIYLPAEKNVGGTITEPLVASSLALEDVPIGTWQIVGIVADRTKIDLDDPSTWDAWDVGTIVLRKPWIGNKNSHCL